MHRRALSFMVVLLACSPTEAPLEVAVVAAADSGEARAAVLAGEQIDGAGGVNEQSIVLSVAENADQISGEPDAVVTDEEMGLRGPLVVVPNSENPSLPQEFVRLTLPATAVGAALAALLVEDGLTSAAVITPETAPAPAVGEAVVTAFSESGGTASLFTYQDPAAVSLEGIAEADPDGVVCVCEGESAADLLRRAFADGLMGRPWYYGPGMHDATVPEAAFPEDPGRLAGQRGIGFDSSSPRGFERFAGAYQTRYGSAPEAGSARVYDAVLLVALAAEVEGPAPHQLRPALVGVSARGQPCVGVDCLELARQGVDLDYVGASGDLDLSESGLPAEVGIVVWQFTLSGDVESVEERRLQP